MTNSRKWYAMIRIHGKVSFVRFAVPSGFLNNRSDAQWYFENYCKHPDASFDGVIVNHDDLDPYFQTMMERLPDSPAAGKAS